jgi:hypothetical protein
MKIFYSYSHKDEELRVRLEKHLAPLTRSGIIEELHDRKITPGVDWAGQLNEYLDSANIILLLISTREKPDLSYTN